MITSSNGADRPPIHLPASESDLVARLALGLEGRQPAVAAMLLEEIERAELHDPETMPSGHATLNSCVTFMDEKTHKVRDVQLVLPANADLAEGSTIEWPDRNGNYRPIRVLRVVQGTDGAPPDAA
jgi:regulator of nucleoside diphosphate kinase